MTRVMLAPRSGSTLCSCAAMLLVACHGGDDAAGPDDSSTAASSSDGGTVSLDTTIGTTVTTVSTTATETTTDDTGTIGSATDVGTSVGGTSDSEGGTTTSIGEDDSSTAVAVEASSSDEAGESSTGEAIDPFPPSPAFGTNILDLDLVGVWGLNWQPETGFDSVIEVFDTGEFQWIETSADCTQSTEVSGHLWVEGMQVVMHVDTWERALPWDTEPVLGETFEAPFRLRMSFSLQGGGSDAYLTIAAPSRVVEGAPYQGASYVRLAQDGMYLGGNWHGEAELQAVRAGETEPVVIVRDVYQALLDPETNPADPEATGTRATTTTYYPVPQASYAYYGGNWTCLGECAASGNALIDSDHAYTYGPYGGYTHLLTFADGRTFRRDAVSDCP